MVDRLPFNADKHDYNKPNLRARQKSDDVGPKTRLKPTT